jgi:predicted ester cyclase
MSQRSGQAAADREAAHRALAEKWFTRGWAGGDISIADEIFAAGFVLNGVTVGPAGPRRSVTAVHNAFSEIEVELDLLLVAGPYTVTHYTATGKHTGNFHGIAPSGRKIRASGIVIWLIRDGKVARDWNCFDNARVISQLTDPLTGIS